MKSILKKIYSFIVIIFLIISTFSTPSLQKVFADSPDNSVIILSGSIQDGDTLTIKANLVVNTGISGMTLELVYDNTAMVLTNLVFGEALASLDPMTTNVNTAKGFAITPFIINYHYAPNEINKNNIFKNDTTKGNLFTMTFKINANATDGNYKVSLKYNKDKDVVYYDKNNEAKTKNLFIDNTEVAIKNNSVVRVVSVKDTDKIAKTWRIIGTVSAGVIVVGLVTFVILLKKRRNWKRL